MNKIVWISITAIALAIPVYADIIVLKDGRTVTAAVLEQDDKKMKIEENGQTVTYFKDQIQSVNGQSLDEIKKTAEPQPSVQEVLDSKEVEDKPKVPVIDAKPSGLSKRALIRKFLEVFGTKKMMSENFEQMLATLPPAKAEEVRKILNVDDVIDNIMHLYDKYFTQEDLEYYIAFYSSEQGQKFLSTLPQIMKESVDVNIEYFKNKIPENEH